MRVAAQEQFGDNVERAGLRFSPFDAPSRDEWMPLMGRFAELDFESAHAVMVGEFFAGLDVSAELPRLIELVDGWRPDLIVRESWEFGSTLVAESRDIPIARVGLGLSHVESESIEIAAPKVDQARRKLGLPPDSDGERLRESPYLTMVPEVLERPDSAAGRRPHRFGYPVREGSKPLPDPWGGGPEPLVYLTFGSVAAAAHLPYFPDVYLAAIEAIAALPVRLLVTIGDAERDAAELGALPGNVHVETWVPHDVAVRSAAVVICHGGFGSMLGTLAHGVPLVVVPVFSLDQWANGEAVSRAKAGLLLADDPADRGALALPSERVIDGLAAAVERIIDDDFFRRGARDVATAVGSLPPVDDAVDLLEGLVA